MTVSPNDWIIGRRIHPESRNPRPGRVQKEPDCRHRMRLPTHRNSPNFVMGQVCHALVLGPPCPILCKMPHAHRFRWASGAPGLKKIDRKENKDSIIHSFTKIAKLRLL